MQKCELADILSALNRLDGWIKTEEWKGWDPYDALSSTFLQRLTFGNRIIGIGVTQLLRRSPINFRPYLGIRKQVNSKGAGLMLSAYLKLYQMDPSSQRLDDIHTISVWLENNTVSGFKGASWGYYFPWANRDFYAPAGAPNAVATCFIAYAFLEMNRLQVQMPELLTGLTLEPLDFLSGACKFILEELNRYKPANDELCFSYTPYDNRYLHNINILCARLLVEIFRITGDECLINTATNAVRYLINRQQADGSWYYGEGKRERFIDSFHTGFILVSLSRIAKLLEIDHLRERMFRGYEYWKENLFLDNLVPKYYPNRAFPIDNHSIAQAILTYLEFSDHDPRAEEQAYALAKWAIGSMQNVKGYFYYQNNRFFNNKIPYMRWSQAWMYYALSELIYAVG